MGGYKSILANVSIAKNMQISVQYTISDNFGAGDDDSGKWQFPGLPALYYLQHYGTEKAYKPFRWDVLIK